MQSKSIHKYFDKTNNSKWKIKVDYSSFKKLEIVRLFQEIITE